MSLICGSVNAQITLHGRTASSSVDGICVAQLPMMLSALK